MRVRAFNVLQGDLRCSLQPPEAQLRPGQAAEFRKCYESDLDKVRPQALVKPSTAPLLSQVGQMVAAHKEVEARKAQEAAACASLAAQPPEVPPPEQQDDAAENEDSSGSEQCDSVMAIPTMRSEGKAKAKSKAKPKPKATGAPKRACKAELAGDAASSRSDMTAASSSSGAAAGTEGGDVGALRRKKKSVLEKAREWPARLSVVTLLTGQDDGKQELWRCSATVQAMKKDHPGHADGVVLFAHYDLCDKALERQQD